MKTSIDWNIIKSKLIKYIKKLIIMILITIVITFILSRFTNLGFKNLLEYVSLAIICVGALSVLGGSKMVMNTQYNYQKFSTGRTNPTKSDLSLIPDSYRFCIFMGISGTIIYLISLIF